MKRLVVELTRASVRVVLAEGSSAKPRVRKCLAESLSGPPTADMLKRLLAGVPSAGASVIGVIPREQAITRLMKLPSIKPDELAQMVRLSAKAQLPYPPDQAMVDFYVIDQQAGTSTVQVVACHREQVDRYVTLLRGSGCEPSVLTPSSWGVHGWYQRLGRSPDTLEPVLVVNVDGDRTDIVLIRGTRVMFSRSLSQGPQMQAAESVATGTPQTPDVAVSILAQELERSVVNFRKELPGMEARSGILTGVGPLAQWAPVLQERLQIPIVVKPMLGSVTLSDPLPPSTSLVVAVGLALVDPQEGVNLLPREVQQAQVQRSRFREFIVTAVLVLLALLVGAGVLSASVNWQGRMHTQTMRALHKLEATTQQTERQEREIAQIQQLLSTRRWTAAMLAEWLKLTSEDLLFESVVFEGARGELVIRGSASGTRQVLDYLRSLKQSDQWDRVELRYSARRSGAASARTDFEILLQGHPHAHAAQPRT